jgi:hypothetical protein
MGRCGWLRRQRRLYGSLLDRDLDYVPDACENCVKAANPLQRDVPFGEPIVAIDPDTFSWISPSCPTASWQSALGREPEREWMLP